jgi:hypothetical protein
MLDPNKGRESKGMMSLLAVPDPMVGHTVHAISSPAAPAKHGVHNASGLRASMLPCKGAALSAWMK